MKTQIILLALVPLSIWTYAIDTDTCSDLKMDVHIKLVMALLGDEKQTAIEEELTVAQEKYQNCLSDHAESECSDLKMDVHIKTVMAIAKNEKQTAIEEELTVAQEKYQNCL